MADTTNGQPKSRAAADATDPSQKGGRASGAPKPGHSRPCAGRPCRVRGAVSHMRPLESLLASARARDGTLVPT